MAKGEDGCLKALKMSNLASRRSSETRRRLWVCEREIKKWRYFLWSGWEKRFCKQWWALCCDVGIIKSQSFSVRQLKGRSWNEGAFHFFSPWHVSAPPLARASPLRWFRCSSSLGLFSLLSSSQLGSAFPPIIPPLKKKKQKVTSNSTFYNSFIF